MGSYRIVVLPGDGIGPEVMNVGEGVLLEAAAMAGGIKLELTRYEAGAEHYRKTGVALPEDVLRACKEADAVYLAAIGLPDVRLADGTEVQPGMMMGLRWALDLYAAVRPIRLRPGVPTPLKDVGKGIDFVIVRENTEGLFASFGGGSILKDQVATDTMVITRTGTERLTRFAFHLAERRRGRPADGQRLVTCVDKANVFRSYAFFRKVFQEMAAQFPHIRSEAIYVDAASLYTVMRPWDFDVIVTENQFGDILSDLGAGIVGGMGMGPSGEIGDRHALFQPSHGSAPSIAGAGVANPLATVLSGAMMLDWLADRHSDHAAARAAASVEAAVTSLLRAGEVLPHDLGGRAGTREVGEALLRHLEIVMRGDAA